MSGIRHLHIDQHLIVDAVPVEAAHGCEILFVFVALEKLLDAFFNGIGDLFEPFFVRLFGFSLGLSVFLYGHEKTSLLSDFVDQPFEFQCAVLDILVDQLVLCFRFGVGRNSDRLAIPVKRIAVGGHIRDMMNGEKIPEILHGGFIVGHDYIHKGIEYRH